MAYSFEFIPNASLGLVTVRLSGFFSEEAVPSIAAGMSDALKRMSCGKNNHMTLVDATDCQIQSQRIVTEFQKLIGDPAFRSRRLAFATGSSLIKMQLRRLINDASYARIFEDEGSALAWLRSEPVI
jgi:hypothetical protein